MAVQPLSDRIVIVPREEAEEKVGSIYIPDSAQEKPLEGTVEAVGPGRVENGERVAPSVKKGDRVLYGKYAGTEIKAEGKDMLIIREGDILAILD
ncbi:MAG: co-chaperone GroES [Spirochaetaceae bacterium]|nr:co-chaperone GroES [Spirochaetaceae bacterium]|tara:strand:+ start:1240 stop:1524 length:285 start_codon:yes stop_codon:yes gene_type:complete